MKRNEPKIEITIEEINPELAKKYLELNRRNRHITKHHAALLTSEMLDDRWVFNGDPIRFDEDGNLIDSQHRLQALIDSGKTYKFVVIRGLPREAFDTIDIGRRRATADLRKFPALEVLNTGYASDRNRLPVSPSILSACHFLMGQKSKTGSDEFMDSVVTGLELKAGDPAYALRNWMIRAKGTRLYWGFTAEVGHNILRTWNAHRSGEELEGFKQNLGSPGLIHK